MRREPVVWDPSLGHSFVGTLVRAVVPVAQEPLSVSPSQLPTRTDGSAVYAFRGGP